MLEVRTQNNGPIPIGRFAQAMFQAPKSTIQFNPKESSGYAEISMSSLLVA